jgi:transposase
MDEVEEEKGQTSHSRGKKMDKEQYRTAKARLVALMQAGQSWQVAKASAGVQTSQSTAYRLLQVVRKQGEVALLDGRHGHPSKLRGEARTFLEEHCRRAPHTPSSVIQTLLQERFDRRVSVSQINRVRAALGVSNYSQSQEPGKKRQKREAL